MELKKYIKESQMTQAQFASELDVTPIAVSRYCNGARVPAAKVMRRIVAVTKGLRGRRGGKRWRGDRDVTIVCGCHEE